MIAPATRALLVGLARAGLRLAGLTAFAAVGVAPAWAQMPAVVVGGTNVIEASRVPSGSAGSSERRAAPRTRSVGEGVGSLSAVSASPGGAAPRESPAAPASDGLAPGGPALPAVLVAAPTLRPVEPGAPIRVRRPAVERADARPLHVAGEAIRVTTLTRPVERPSGPGASIHVVE